jgi:hypothetical protein
VVTVGGVLSVTGTTASGAVNGDNITLVDATTTTTLAQVNFTVADVSLKSITFTSNYQTSSSYDGSPVKVNGVNAATNLSSDGVSVVNAAGFAMANNGSAIGSADWSPGADGSYAIAQKMGTSITATLVVDVQPAGFQYTIGSVSYEADDAPMSGSYMDFHSNAVTTAFGCNDEVDVTAAGVLPSMIADLNQQVLWSVSAASGNFSSPFADTSHEVLVTYDNPITGLSILDSDQQLPASITDKRLEVATAACAGLGENPTQYDVALAIQHWFPDNAYWNAAGPVPTAADQYWALVGPKNPGYYSNCFQFGSLEELMLKSLGIQAQREFLCATPQAAWATGNAIYMAAGQPQSSQPVERDDPNLRRREDALVLNFPGGMNVGEGAVRVGDCVYTEGPPADLVVGKDNECCLQGNPAVPCTAELEALVELAISEGVSLDTFQDWAIVVGTTPAIEPGDQCEQLPYLEPYD